MVKKIKKQSNKTSIVVWELILIVLAVLTLETIVLPVVFAIAFIVVMFSKKYSYECGNCGDPTNETSKKCYKCGEEFSSCSDNYTPPSYEK